MIMEESKVVNSFMGLIYLAVTLFFVFILLVPGIIYPSYIMVIGSSVFVFILMASVKFYISYSTALGKPLNFPELEDYPFVSIVIASYNEELVLNRTIRSMLNLDYPKDRIEFIYVYEDHGTDRTEDILKDHAAKDDRVVPLKRKSDKGGKAAAANYGIRHARGTIIGIFDADHSLNTNTVKRAVSLFTEPDIMCVKGWCRALNKNQGFLAKLVGIERDVVERIGLYSAYRINGFATFGGGHAFFRKKVFEELGEFDEDTMTEDIDFSVRIQLAGYRIVVHPKIESWEENPDGLLPWWHQRKRWARGWMQVWRKQKTNIFKSDKLPAFKKFDMLMGLFLTLYPMITILFFPMALLSFMGYDTIFLPDSISIYFIIFIAITPIMGGFLAWTMDVREGEKPRYSELLYIPLLLPYIIFQFGVGWVAFIEEFLIKQPSIYIKTTRASVPIPKKVSP